MKALVVDDSRTVRMMLKRFLLAEGFDTIHEAGDGREALNKLAEVGPVQLALVDWNMPVLDGIDFINELRRDKKFDAVRVMMVTTESGAPEIARALDAGANEYIMKPFSPEGLRAKLDMMGFERKSA